MFDEVYFVKFAQAYLTGTPQFDAHPPLGKYLIAAGIWLSTHVPFVSWPFATAVNPDTGLSPFSYRWMTALVGSCIPVLVMAIAHTLSDCTREYPAKRQTFVLLSGFFVAIDGLFITESRYALLNVYMVFFGLLGHWLWLRAALWTEAGERARASGYRLLAGIALGGAIAVKWNGLGYWLSLFLWDILRQSPWQMKGRSLRRYLLKRLLYGGLIPALTYWLLWQPHLSLTGESLLQIHAQVLTFHQQLAALGHPACSKWYTWPLLVKPIAYWYETVGTQTFTVNNLGNPTLWWLSSAAVLLLLLKQVIVILKNLRSKAAFPASSHIGTYLLVSYVANWLPWIAVERCTFIYLYMPAAIFSFMVLAWRLSGWLQRFEDRVSRTVGVAMVGIIILAFLFWLPLSLGSPLSSESLQLRWWLRSWI